MTIEMTGLVASQNRIAELQARMGLATGGAATTLTSNTAAFDASMRGALSSTTAAASTQRASAAAPFVFDPTAAPGQVKAKPGAAQALATVTSAAKATPATTSATAAATMPAASSASTATSSAVRSTAASAVSATSRTTAAHPVAATSAAGSAARVDEVIADAKKYLGTPYLWGGTNPANGLDCSGFTQLVFKQNGVSLPRVARDQQKQGTKVPSLAEARPGDLITFGNPAHHIGIYLGNNKFIHAPHTGDVVKISTVYRKPSSIRRVLPDSAWQAGSAPAASPATSAVRAGSTAATAAKPAGVGATTTSAPVAAAASSTTASTAARALTTSAAPASATRAAAAGVANTAATNPAASSAAASKGGWAGAPADDTWGAASAGAASLGVTALAAGAPGSPNAAGVAGGTISPAAVAPARARTPRVASTPAASLASGGVLAQAPARYRPLFTAAAAKYGVPADLLAAVAKQESNFKSNAVSHAGARGLMQLMPGTARGLGVKNSFDPAQAVDGAARLLRDHLKTFKGSTELALAAYNAGAGAVRRYGGVPPYGETQTYVRKIMANLRASAA